VDDAAPTPPRRSLIGQTADLGRKLFRVLPDAADSYFADRCSQFAAAIAYRVLFSIAPLAIVLISVAGLLLQDPERQAAVVDEIVGLLPTTTGADEVEAAVTNVAQPTSALGLISVIAFAWTATGMMWAFRVGLEAAMHVEQRRSAARGKLVDMALVMAAGSLVILLVVISNVSRLVRSSLQTLLSDLGIDSSWLSVGVGRLLPFIVSVFAVLLLYRFGPASTLPFRDRLAGAIVTAVLLLLLSFASGLVYARTTELSVVFGSLTTLFTFLYTVYLDACALLFGAEVAAAWSRPPTNTLRTMRDQMFGIASNLLGRARNIRRPPDAPE
jgi:membrane protein